MKLHPDFFLQLGYFTIVLIVVVFLAAYAVLQFIHDSEEEE